MRRLPALIATATLAAAPLTVAHPAAAAPAAAPAASNTAAPNPAAPNPAAAGTAASNTGRPAVPVGSYDVTLITGDRVHLTVQPGGKQTAAVRPAVRDDGRTPSVQTVVRDGRLYVVPGDVAGYLDSRLDRELFDVTGLVRDGYDDRAAGSVPVILAPAGGVAARTAVKLPPAMVATRRLASIGATAARVSKVDASAFGRALAAQARTDHGDVTPNAATGLFAGIGKVWLDDRVRVSDEDSAPQVGAPAAWAAGYTGSGVQVAVLDTGIDSTHPDLAGKVTAAANFSTAGSTTDHFGHGSHVASIIAGSGAASGGRRQGIGFGASLLNAKVLDDSGNGADSGIIAGAEWAAQHGARVANLSLGSAGFHSDGTDPLSQALDRLTDQYGTLFVVAAGNDGGVEQTVTSPGTADRALTVGAVDKHDALADFSSRGPRAGDFAIKPDITAPGVDIIAARAAGTGLGSPVDADYTTLSGTSMATPHVAGAAAVLLQEHPQWTAAQVKAALVQTAAPATAYTVYQQGGGRLDLARATRQAVTADTGSLSLGYFPFPQANDQPVTRTITYQNAGSASVTLSLAAAVSDEHGTAAVTGVLALSATTVTVPAGGSAPVTVTLDPRIGDFGRFGGYLTATGGSTVLRTPVGYYRESVRYDLTVRGLARDGRPAGGISTVDVMNVDNRDLFMTDLRTLTGGTLTVRVPPGRYNVFGYLFTYDEPSVYALDGDVVDQPEVAVNADTTVVLDARAAREIAPKAADPTEPTTITLDYYRGDAVGNRYEHSFTLTPPIGRAYAAPTEPVTVGTFEFYSYFSLRAPLIRMHTATPAGADLHPLYAVGSPQLDGHQVLPVVYAGLGKPEDFTGLDVRGKVALIKRGDITFVEKIHNATAAGAAVVLIFNHSPGQLFIAGSATDAPALSLSQVEGEALAGLVARGPVTLDLTGVRVSPYQYDLIFPEPNRIPAAFRYDAGPSNLATVDTTYRSDVTDRPAGELRYSWRPWQLFAVGFLRTMPSPLHRVEYVSSGDTRWQHNVYASSTATEPFDASGWDEIRTFQPGQWALDTWWGQPAHPAALPAGAGPSATRTGDTLTMRMPEFGDAAGHWAWLEPTDQAAFRLFQDGKPIATAAASEGTFALGADPATYRLELDASRTADWWPLSTSTSTVWTVASSRPAGGATTTLPLVNVDYVPVVDQFNRGGLPGAVQISTGHIPGAPASAVAGLKVWISPDGGASWTLVPQVRPIHSGQFFVPLPKPARTNGFLSLRVEAWDAQGGRIQQTINRAWAVP